MRPDSSNRLVAVARCAVIAVAAALLAPAVFAQTPPDPALVLDPLSVIETARPPRGSSFKDLVIGRSTRSLVTAALGQPTGGGGNVVEWTGTADCRTYAFHRITARFDATGVLDQIWIQLRRPLHPETVIEAYQLTTPSAIQPNGEQQVRVFSPIGFAMGITNGVVDGLWLTRALPASPGQEPAPPGQPAPAEGPYPMPGPGGPVGSDAVATGRFPPAPPEAAGWPPAGEFGAAQPPGEEAVGAVALAFLAATNRGDVAALRRVATENLARRLEEDLEGQTQDDRAERAVRTVACDGDRARAVVWMKDPAEDSIYAELLATVELQRTSGCWLVARFTARPYVRDFDEGANP